MAMRTDEAKPFWPRRRVGDRELTLFTRQFSVLINAGFPIYRALGVLERIRRPGGLRDGVGVILGQLEQGASLPEAFAEAPRLFDETQVALIRAGAAGGFLDRVLIRLADFREKKGRLKHQILCLLLRASAMVFIAVAMLALMLAGFVPMYKGLFEDMGLALAPTTKALWGASDLFIGYWHWPPLVAASAAVAVWRIGKTAGGRRILDWAAFYAPVYGGIARRFALSRFCWAVGELTAADVPILAALRIAQPATGNTTLASAVAALRAGIVGGQTLDDLLWDNEAFPPVMAEMAEAGWETDTLDRAFLGMADLFDSEVEARIRILACLLESVLLIVLGLAIGFMLIAFFAPFVRTGCGLG